MHINYDRRPCSSLSLIYFLQFFPKHRPLKGWLRFTSEKPVQTQDALRAQKKTEEYVAMNEFDLSLEHAKHLGGRRMKEIRNRLCYGHFCLRRRWRIKTTAFPTKPSSLMRSIIPKIYLKYEASPSMAVFSSPKQFLETGMTRTWKFLV